MSSEFRILKKVGVPQRSCSEFSFKKKQKENPTNIEKDRRGVS